jgi:integrase
LTGPRRSAIQGARPDRPRRLRGGEAGGGGLVLSDGQPRRALGQTGHWARQIRAAAKSVNEKARGAARIPTGVGAYSFRHTRISELLQVFNVDPLTVGHQTGTSLAMIEKAYTRFIPEALQEKLAVLKAKA